jgi:hypothetical protein
MVYGFGRIDASGQVADRATIAALGWRGGDRLTLTTDAGVMIARRDIVMSADGAPLEMQGVTVRGVITWGWARE